jgi:hypothetical protein
MSYSEFSVESLKSKFALEFIEDTLLFPHIKSCEVPTLLSELLHRYTPLAITINTEKARSELIIAPLLAEFKLKFKDTISLFSGTEFNIDAALGLNGRCDYLISKSKEQLVVDAPVIMLVEAKNENLTAGIPQCIAEMVAARKFNQNKKNEIEIIYGAVTSGSLWRFLKLSENQIYIDTVEYSIQNLDKIFGILTEMVSV